MKYTVDQYALLKKLLPGIRYSQLSAQEREILTFLDYEKLVQYRVQIADDYVELSQQGLRVFAEHLADVSDSEKVSHNKAEQKRQQRFENKIAVANLLVPLVTFILGLLAEHFGGIISWFASLF